MGGGLEFFFGALVGSLKPFGGLDWWFGDSNTWFLHRVGIPLPSIKPPSSKPPIEGKLRLGVWGLIERSFYME